MLLIVRSEINKTCKNVQNQKINVLIWKLVLFNSNVQLNVWKQGILYLVLTTNFYYLCIYAFIMSFLLKFINNNPILLGAEIKEITWI